ncbi:hypothetical protein DIURU_001586 [Diutina rugosa]|uniref:SH3 domain-containing protein n=1 Tax=Diutina rugosa TaxID=5481 RepID=A0A642V032_DIURU|nr:uncharacterized protein DIURU_001586 [Diutina rugosa]KAA8905158.1 hypothetical protein DIURU_001586 [Diutina rugosa]
MSAALINRSLTTVRTELEFLKDSEVITEALYNKIVDSLPQKYQSGAAPVDVDVLGGPVAKSTTRESDLSSSFAAMKVTHDTSAPPAGPPPDYKAPPPQSNKPLGYCKALYDYQSSTNGDLELNEGDRIAITEHLSEDWWKGYKKGDHPDKPGVFPSNYVETISESEFKEDNSRLAPPPPQKKESFSSNYSQPPPQQQQHQPNYSQSSFQSYGPMNPQPSYGGYAQFPPPSTNYYPPQQYQQAPAPVPVQQEEHHHGGAMKKFGSKLGNAAIFGAGATIGSDIVNSIF